MCAAGSISDLGKETEKHCTAPRLIKYISNAQHRGLNLCRAFYRLLYPWNPHQTLTLSKNVVRFQVDIYVFFLHCVTRKSPHQTAHVLGLSRP